MASLQSPRRDGVVTIVIDDVTYFASYEVYPDLKVVLNSDYGSGNLYASSEKKVHGLAVKMLENQVKAWRLGIDYQIRARRWFKTVGRLSVIVAAVIGFFIGHWTDQVPSRHFQSVASPKASSSVLPSPVHATSKNGNSIAVGPTSLDWPAWVQAVGSVLAILVSVYVAYINGRQNRRLAERETLGLLRALRQVVWKASGLIYQAEFHLEPVPGLEGFFNRTIEEQRQNLNNLDIENAFAELKSMSPRLWPDYFLKSDLLEFWNSFQTCKGLLIDRGIPTKDSGFPSEEYGRARDRLQHFKGRCEVASGRMLRQEFGRPYWKDWYPGSSG